MRSSVMLAALGDEFNAASQVTGEDGLFLFDGIDLYDTTILVLQGSVYRERRAQRRARQGVDDSFTAGSDNWISFHLSEPEIIPGRVDIPAASIAEEVMAAYLEDSMKDPMLSYLEDIWSFCTYLQQSVGTAKGISPCYYYSLRISPLRTHRPTRHRTSNFNGFSKENRGVFRWRRGKPRRP